MPEHHPGGAAERARDVVPGGAPDARLGVPAPRSAPPPRQVVPSVTGPVPVSRIAAVVVVTVMLVVGVVVLGLVGVVCALMLAGAAGVDTTGSGLGEAFGDAGGWMGAGFLVGAAAASVLVWRVVAWYLGSVRTDGGRAAGLVAWGWGALLLLLVAPRLLAG